MKKEIKKITKKVVNKTWATVYGTTGVVAVTTGVLGVSLIGNALNLTKDLADTVIVTGKTFAYSSYLTMQGIKEA